MKKLIILTLVLLVGLATGQAQQHVGTQGLIHVPSAEMDTVGVARIGAHYV